MVKPTKSSTESVAAPAAPVVAEKVPKVKAAKPAAVAAAAAPAVTESVAAPVVAKTPKVKAAAKPAAVAAAVAPAVTESVAAASTPAVVDAAATTSDIPSEPIAAIVLYDKIVGDIKQVMTLSAEITKNFRALTKLRDRDLKAAQKAGQKKKRKNSNHAPSGFTKPTMISNDMAAFLGVENGTIMPRTHVTKQIGEYIKQQTLQKEGDGRIIHADDKLAKLLNIPRNQDGKHEMHYFKLQTFLQPHFPKPVAAAAAVAV